MAVEIASPGREVVDAFCATYFDLNQISPQRRTATRALLYRWVDWCEDFGADPLAIDHELIETWMTLLIKQRYSPNTVRFYLGMLKPFYRWAGRGGRVTPESLAAMDDIEPPRGAVVNGRPRPYTRPEIQSLWRAIDREFPASTERRLTRFRRGTSSFKLVRTHGQRLQMRAIVALGLYMGLRRNEIWTLSLDAMHPDNDAVVVKRKRSGPGEKERELPYSDAARQAVLEWFQFRRWMAPDHQSPWLRLRNPDPAAQVSLTTFKSLLARVGDGYEFHRLRHTCATERLRAGMPLPLLKEFLGHATLDQTLVYADIVFDDVERAMAKSDENFMLALAPKVDEPEPPPKVDTSDDEPIEYEIRAVRRKRKRSR